MSANTIAAPTSTHGHQPMSIPSSFSNTSSVAVANTRMMNGKTSGSNSRKTQPVKKPAREPSAWLTYA